jgi:transcriptional regulator with XRE-family HTH domain
MVGKYERNISTPGGDVLIKIHEVYDVDITWLLTGHSPGGAPDLTFKNASGEVHNVEVKTISSEPDEDLAAFIGDGISRLYKEEGARISPGDLSRMVARIYSEAMLFQEPTQRPVFVAGALGMLKRELRKPIASTGPSGSSKRSA